jgi:ABC-2 type transport system permease protein
MRSKSNLPAYLQIVSLLTQTAFAYRVELVVELAGLLLKVFLLRVVWTAVYAGRTEVDGVPLEEVIGFMTLANLQLFLMASWIAGYLYDRIRQGLIALDLARPVPFMGQLMAYQVGGTVALLPFLLVAAPLAFLVGGLQLPASPIAAALYLVSLLLAYLVSTLTIYLGRTTGLAALGLLGLQLFWVLLLGGCVALVWRRAMRRVVVQGG